MAKEWKPLTTEQLVRKIRKEQRDAAAALAARRPKDGWWRGDPLLMPGSYLAETGLQRPMGISLDGGGADAERGARHAASVRWQPADSVESNSSEMVWTKLFRDAPGAEARCRTEAENARARFQAYYDATGERWEVRAKKERGLPKLPPKVS